MDASVEYENKKSYVDALRHNCVIVFQYFLMFSLIVYFCNKKPGRDWELLSTWKYGTQKIRNWNRDPMRSTTYFGDERYHITKYMEVWNPKNIEPAWNYKFYLKY